MDSSDPELVRRAQHGEQAAFHELVDRHANYLFRLAVSLVGNTPDAEDIVQETFTGAFRSLRAFRGSSSVKTWLSRILIRQTAGHWRKRSRAVTLRLAEPSAAPAATSSGPQASDERMDMSAAIAALSPEHRDVVVLRELQGLSYAQIAEILSIPPGTVESRLFRARKALQQSLKAYMNSGPGLDVEDGD